MPVRLHHVLPRHVQCLINDFAWEHAFLFAIGNENNFLPQTKGKNLRHPTHHDFLIEPLIYQEVIQNLVLAVPLSVQQCTVMLFFWNGTYSFRVDQFRVDLPSF